MRRLFWIIREGPKCNYTYPCKREVKGDLTHIQRGGNAKMKQREVCRCWPWRLEWCGHKPRSASSHQKLDKQGLGHFWEPLEKVWPCPHLDLGLLNFRTMREQISTVFRHQFLIIWYSSPRKLTKAVRLSDISGLNGGFTGVSGSASNQEA